MTGLRETWRDEGAEHALDLVHVPGTGGRAFSFGAGNRHKPIELRDFWISATPVTQALWKRVTGSNPAVRVDPRCPVENVSWDHVRGPGGFLDRLRDSDVLRSARDAQGLTFRLPSETEWEYAARGGPAWRDGLRFSGADDADAVAWYGPRWTRGYEWLARALGARRGWRVANRIARLRPRRTQTHPVASKAANQLGLYDMSGNVWEWCEDGCTDDLDQVPEDGRPWQGPGDDRRLRGGCHHNWDLHCTVAWRYGIAKDAHDGCIGFRLVLAPADGDASGTA